MLATFVVIYGAIQIAPLAQQARHFSHWVDTIEEDGDKFLAALEPSRSATAIQALMSSLSMNQPCRPMQLNSMSRRRSVVNGSP